MTDPIETDEYRENKHPVSISPIKDAGHQLGVGFHQIRVTGVGAVSYWQDDGNAGVVTKKKMAKINPKFPVYIVGLQHANVVVS